MSDTTKPVNNPLEEASELLKLREAATEGPWSYAVRGMRFVVGKRGEAPFLTIDYCDADTDRADAAFIASAHRMADCLAALLARFEGLERGEYICKSCGLRKDSDHEKGHF